MKRLNYYITEKLKFKINSKTVKHYDDNDLFQDIQEKILDELCQYFSAKFKYQGEVYQNGIELIEKKFNNQICSLLDRTGSYKKICDKIGISFKEFINYVEPNNNKLYKEIKDFVL